MFDNADTPAKGIDAFPGTVYGALSRESITDIFAVLPLLMKKVTDNGDLYLLEIQKQGYGMLRRAINIEVYTKLQQLHIPLKTLDLTSHLSSLQYCMDTLSEIPVRGSFPEGPVYAKVNEYIFTVCILEVLRNSMQYTRDGNVIDISMEAFPNRVQITIRDRALGIKQKYIDSIWEPYFSRNPYGDDGHTPQLGLGLPMLLRALHLFSGSRVMETEFGKGSTLVITLPRAGAEDDADGMNVDDWLLNRYSPLYVHLYDFCRLPDL